MSQISEWRSKVELTQKQHSQLEMELGKAKGLLAKEIETRRQQMSEISQAREFERREWKRQHDENLKCIAREQQQQIKQMRAQYMDDVENTVSDHIICSNFSWCIGYHQVVAMQPHNLFRSLRQTAASN